MKTSVQRIILLISILFISGMHTTVDAQNHRKEGDEAWAKGRYKTAVNKYGMVESLKSDKKLLAKRGEGFFKLNMLEKAIHHFTQSRKIGNNDPELFWMMAQCKHHMEAYDEAAYFYKSYIKEVGEKSPKSKWALRELKNCSYATLNRNNDPVAFVKNFGPEINTYYDEIYPIQSPRYGNVYYFTSNRNLKDMDVYSYELNAQGKWQENKDFEDTVNTSDDQYGMDVSMNGLSMLYGTTPEKKPITQIHVSTYDYEDKQHFIHLPDYILDGAMDIQVIDHNSIAFASNQLGGMGGYDIFTINYQNGIWSDPINEGAPINSEYDDRSPCYAATGDYLYFSSNRPYCFGGFDIYYYNKLSIGKQPSNIGMPINGPGDDLQFRMNADGQNAIMSSDRKTGQGAYDLYMVYMNEPKPMPDRGKGQLSYVRDYFKKVFPEAEPVAEKKKSHLEKLKEKLALEEEANKEEEEKTPEPVEEVVDMEEAEQKAEPIEAEPAEEILPADEVVEVVTDAGPDVQSEMETDVSEEIEEEPGPVLKKEEPIVIAEEEPVTPVQQPEETKSRVEEPEVELEKDAAITIADRRKNTESDKPTSTKDALPQTASSDSPLKTIQKQRKATDQVPVVDRISGEKISYALLYQDRHDLMNAVNKEKVLKLLQYLKSNPDHHVHIIAHTDHLEPGLPEFMQYNTLKRANYIGRFLLENNIPKRQVSLESVCSNYPLAKPEVAGELNKKYLAYNKRIEYEIQDEDGVVLASHNISNEKIPGYALASKYELFSQVREELYYSVQIATSKHIFKNAVLRLYDNIYIRRDNPLSENEYYIGIFTTFEEAEILQKELAESSAPFAKIKAFYRGMPLRDSELKSLSEEYPDLKNFLSLK